MVLNMVLKRKISPALMVSVIAIISKVVGIFREVVLANYFGTSNISDAYLIASSVPTLLFYFIGHSISTAYIPMYNKARLGGGERCGLLYTNRIINIALAISSLIVFLLFACPEVAVKIFALGFDDETTAITVRLIRINASSMFFMILISVLSGYLQANKNFVVPALMGLPRNGIIVISIIVAASFGLEYLGWGLVVSYIAELLLLLPFSFKKGYKYIPTMKISDSYVRDTGYVIIPILIGMCVSQINKIIDRSLASMVCEGGVSALTYASVINNAVQEVLVTGIITVLFSNCAAWVAKGEHDKVTVKLADVLNVFIMVLLPAAVGVIILSEPIVVLLLARGEFNSESVAMTAGALCFYTSGLFFLAVRDTLVKVFYAYQKTKTTTVVAIIAIGINIVLNLILYHFIGLNGLALATVISAVFNCLTLYILLRQQIGDFGLRLSAITAFKSLLSCVVMAIIVMVVKMKITLGAVWLDLALCTFVGMLSYFFVALLLRVEPLISILQNFGILKNTKN